jgi:Glycosyltransferase family 9 (heptosyltransferase)
LRLGTTLDTIPPATPYLNAPAERLAGWRDRVPGGPGRKVGIAWSGNPKLLRDRQRSISLDSLSLVLELPGISFVTLNPALAPEDEKKLARLGNVVHLAKDFSDFADTAAAMAQLDLIISVDTAIAHLAGALGKPVWILLPYVPDWRWMLDRHDSPWYPTARLFRQPKSGDWASVIATIRQELAGTHY